MRYLISLFLFLFLVNCSLNKVSNTHGTRFIEKKYNKIILNKTNKNDVRKLIGPPSTTSKFGDIWFYIERKKTNQSLFKLGKKKISENNVVLIVFNNKALVSNKKIMKLSDMNNIKIVEKITKKKFQQNNMLYDLLSTLREKVNAPTRRKK